MSVPGVRKINAFLQPWATLPRNPFLITNCIQNFGCHLLLSFLWMVSDKVNKIILSHSSSALMGSSTTNFWVTFWALGDSHTRSYLLVTWSPWFVPPGLLICLVFMSVHSCNSTHWATTLFTNCWPCVHWLGLWQVIVVNIWELPVDAATIHHFKGFDTWCADDDWKRSVIKWIVFVTVLLNHCENRRRNSLVLLGLPETESTHLTSVLFMSVCPARHSRYSEKVERSSFSINWQEIVWESNFSYSWLGFHAFHRVVRKILSSAVVIVGTILQQTLISVMNISKNYSCTISLDFNSRLEY